ncbi:MAG: response regulator [Silicimonas sp.]|nr:response regulator [Silicimonas sp.]
MNTQTAPQPSVQKSPIKQMNVLVLDDSEVDRKTLIRLCNRAGLNCIMTEADSLLSFRRALDHTSFDLIFIDYFLGADTGLDALNTITEHSNQSAAATIMIAGEGQVGIAVEAMRQGCADYLTKSMLTVEALQKSVATALERQMIMAQFAEERQTRQMLEASVQRYAEAATAEMRNLLSATLRRVRLMRRHKAGPDYTHDLSTLEVEIDRLWEALPNFKEKVSNEITDGQRQKALH